MIIRPSETIGVKSEEISDHAAGNRQAGSVELRQIRGAVERARIRDAEQRFVEARERWFRNRAPDHH